MSFDDPFSSLMTVEINATELCNRTCSFCPRGVDYPNLNEHMDPAHLEVLFYQLKKGGYKNRILFCGFSEPLLYKYIDGVIEQSKMLLPDSPVHLVTNTDRLTKDTVTRLFDCGLDLLICSVYDSPSQVDELTLLFNDCGIDSSQYFFQHYYKSEEEQFGFAGFSSRAGYLFKHETISKPCNMPFYSILVDWNGDFLLCCHDWKKSVKLGNVTNSNIKKVWLEHPELLKFRANLSKGNRQDYPCRDCNVSGTLYGNRSKEILSNEQV